MPETAVYAPGTVTWVDLASKEVEKSKAFYSKLFNWQTDKIEDPQAGGYTWFLKDGKHAAAISPVQGEQQPTAWSIYFATKDADKTAQAVKDAGGKVVAEPFDVMGTGRMAVFQDSTGAFFSVWQAIQNNGFEVEPGQPNTYAWAELNTRGIDRAREFYKKVFGWDTKISDMGNNMGEYTEFQLKGESLAGGMDMTMQPASVPPYWMVYFASTDVDASTKKVKELGGKVMVEPTDFPGGRFSIDMDPQGGAFGILTMKQR